MSSILQIRDENGNWIEIPAIKGKKGDDGYTPVKGTDYWTEEDKAEIVKKVAEVSVAKNQGSENVGKILVVGTDGNLTLTDMPEGGASGDVIGTLDDSNNILLSGNLADGTYTLKYENADGTYTEVGSLEVNSIVTYTVTQNLTNVTSDNSVTSVKDGDSLTVNLTANDGYSISSIVVTMGETDITSSAVSGGTISIAEVSGEIVITAVAEETTVEITNWIKEVGYTTDTRLSLSSGGTTTASGYECTGFIPVKTDDVIRIKNIDLTQESSTNIVGYDGDKQPYRGGATSGNYGMTLYGLFVTNGTNDGDVYTATLKGTYTNAFNESMAYIRIGSKSITDESILTVNQEIV